MIYVHGDWQSHGNDIDENGVNNIKLINLNIHVLDLTYDYKRAVLHKFSYLTCNKNEIFN